MRIFGKKKKIDEEIEDVLNEMRTVSSASPEYTTMAKNLAILQAIKSKDAERKVKIDTILLVGGNLLGIAMILYRERTDIITSKAVNFVLKGRV